MNPSNDTHRTVNKLIIKKKNGNPLPLFSICLPSYSSLSIYLYCHLLLMSA